MPAIFRWHFQMHFLEWNCINVALDVTEVCFQGTNYQYPSIGPDNGLAPTRQQAIIWTNDGLFTVEYIHHSASMSLYDAIIATSRITLCGTLRINMLTIIISEYWIKLVHYYDANALLQQGGFQLKGIIYIGNLTKV